MQIVGFAQERGACTTLRIKQPLERIAELQLAKAHIIAAADANTESLVRDSDVVFLGRAASDHVLDVIKRVQMFGKKVVFDLDDNMFDVSVFSPHYKDLGAMNVDFDDPSGSKIDVWRDGAGGFDVRRNRGLRKSFIRLVRQADCVTVTTEPLRKVYSRFNANVKIVPNAINFRVWDKQNIGWLGDEVRILYTGAANHFEDWLFVYPGLEEIQKKYKNVTIVLIGTDWRQATTTLDYSRIEVHRWVDFEAYPHLMKSLCCHIGLAPIRPSDFNDCRSELKWVEYSALKMATVATNWGPYKRSMKDKVTGLLAENDKDEWVKALSELIENKEYRETLGNNAYQDCKKNFNLDYAVDQWMNVFSDVLGIKS